jgi:hypothetical protein
MATIFLNSLANQRQLPVTYYSPFSRNVIQKITGTERLGYHFKMLVNTFLSRLIINGETESIATKAKISHLQFFNNLHGIISSTPSTNGNLPLLVSITVL